MDASKMSNDHLLHTLRLLERRAAIRFYRLIQDEAVRRGLKPAFRRV
jgi:hypothetical protein